MTNRYPGPCAQCVEWVPPYEGKLDRVDDAWQLAHIACPPDEDERNADAYAEHLVRLGDAAIVEAYRAAPVISTEQSAWYDHAVHRLTVPEGTTTHQVRDALSRRWHSSLTGSAVGGYTTVGKVTLVDPSTIDVEAVYHIGD